MGCRWRLRADCLPLRHSAAGVDSRRVRAFNDPRTGFDETPTDNGSLISGSSGARNGPGNSCRGAAGRGRLNAFFAFSVNSPSKSMVNFSCCVRSAPKPCAT